MPPPASYSLVGSQAHSTPQFSGFYSNIQVTSGKITSLPGHSGLLRLRHVIFNHETASCELQPSRKSYTQYTPVFGLLQLVPGDFRLNDVTSRSLPVTWGHVTSFPVTWLPPPASYSFVGSQMHTICQVLAFYSHFQVISGQMTSVPVTWGCVTWFPVTWLPSSVSYSLVKSQTHSIRQFSAFYSHFQVTTGQMTLLPGHFGSPKVTWRDFLSRYSVLLQATAL